MNDSVSDKVRFFYSFLRSPRKIGSITPSSPFLTKKMMDPISWNQIHTVVELGAGTGVFTKQIDQLLPKDRCGIIFEQNAILRDKLQQKYSRFIYHDNALDLKKKTIEMGISEVDAILSGLPFANFPPQERHNLIQTVYQTLKPGGLFIAFQYSLQMKKMLQEIFSSVALSFVPINIPPAVVYTCRKM